MGKISKFINGEYVGEVQDDVKVLGKPFLAVYGESEPKHLENDYVVSWPLCGKLKLYIRYEMAPEVMELLEKDAKSEARSCSCVLTGRMMEHYHLNPAEEMQKAVENMRDRFRVEPIGSVLSDMKSMPINLMEILPSDHPFRQISVVRTDVFSERFGAGVIGSKTILESIRKEKGDFYIIPSSIHELIIVPASLGGTEGLTEMIKEVNSTVLEPEDILANELYKYDETGLYVA